MPDVAIRSADVQVETAHGLEYRPALDGLRGLAVAGVVAFHLGHLQGGFLGVDAFFTLSGYLITRLLLDEHRATGSIAFGAFWSRRAWRLLPALYAVVAAVAVYALVGAAPGELGDLRSAGLASLLFVANWWFIASGAGYWDQFAVPSPLEHVWSLAIEQQFYVVWPVVVAAVLRGRQALDRLLVVTLALAGVSTLWLAYLSFGDVSRAYFGSGGRAGSILLGAALAIVIHRRDPWVSRVSASSVGPWLAAVAGAGIAVAWVSVNGERDSWFYLGGYLAHALGVAVIIAVLTFRTTGVSVRVLECAPLRRLGVISYGLYLWHWPVIVVVDAERVGISGNGLLLVRLALSLLLAEVSFRLVETPARRRLAGKLRAAVAFPVAAALVATALVVATRPPESTVTVTTAAPPPISPPVPVSVAAETSSDGSHDSGPGTSEPTNDPLAAPSLLVTTPDRSQLPSLRTSGLDDPPRVLLVGDSYMFDAQPGIEAALEAMQVDAVGAARLGFTITVDGWQDSLRSAVVDHDPDLVIAMWARFDAVWLESNDRSAYEQRLDEAIELLTAGGAAVGFVGLAPSLDAGVDRQPVDRSINEIFVDVHRRSDRAFYIDPDPIVAPDGEPTRRIQSAEGELLVRKLDVSHYCSDGSARFGLAISELVSSLVALPTADPASWWRSDWRADERYDSPSGSCR